MNTAPTIHARCDYLWSSGLIYAAAVLVTIGALLLTYSELIVEKQPLQADYGVLLAFVLCFWGAALFLPAHEVQICVTEGLICKQRKLLWFWRKKIIPYSVNDVLCINRPRRKITMASLSNDGGTICLLRGPRAVPLFTNLHSCAECERVYAFLLHHLRCQSVPFKR